MDLKVIKELIKSFEKSNVHKLEVEQDGLKVKLEKEDKQYTVVSEGLVPQALPQVSQNTVADKLLEEVDNGIKVVAPLVGTFYSASTPEAEPFVVKGSVVKKGQTVCIIEAMKVMNEISAPHDGVIRSVVVKNGSMVEFDEVIMTIE